MAAQIDPRAVALQGLGYSPRLFALQGLWPSDEQPPDAAPGFGYAPQTARRKRRGDGDDEVLLLLIR